LISRCCALASEPKGRRNSGPGIGGWRPSCTLPPGGLFSFNLFWNQALPKSIGS